LAKFTKKCLYLGQIAIFFQKKVVYVRLKPKNTQVACHGTSNTNEARGLKETPELCGFAGEPAGANLRRARATFTAHLVLLAARSRLKIAWPITTAGAIIVPLARYSILKNS
jgi:hypothetical protein